MKAMNILNSEQLIRLLDNGGIIIKGIREELLCRLKYYEDNALAKKETTEKYKSKLYEGTPGNHYEGVDEFPGSDY